MSQFDPAVNFVLKHEGGYYSDIQTGEESNFGISRKFLAFINYRDKDPKRISIDQAKDIYKSCFYKPNKLDQISSQLIANKLLDMIVNMGAYKSIKLLQASINSIGGQCVIDGIMGSFTLLTIEQLLLSLKDGEKRLLEELRIKSIGYYTQIAKGPLAKDLKGWIVRANDVGLGEVDQNSLRSGLDDKII